MKTEDLWRTIANRDLGALVQVLNDRTVLKEVGMEKPKTLEITVNVPRDAIPVKLVVMQCRTYEKLWAKEKGLKNDFGIACPYCGLGYCDMLFDPIEAKDFTGFGYREKKESEKGDEK